MTKITDERRAKPYVKRNAPGHDGDGGKVVVPFETDAEMRRILSAIEASPAPVSEQMVEQAARAIAGTAYEGVYFTTRSREEYIDAEWRNHETDARTALTATLAAKGGQ